MSRAAKPADRPTRLKLLLRRRRRLLRPAGWGLAGFAVVLLGILSRAATILFILKQAAARIAKLADRIMTQARRLDFRQPGDRGQVG